MREAVDVEALPGADAVHHHVQRAGRGDPGSFCRSEPAAALRGLAKGLSPASTSRALSSSKASIGK